MPAKLILLAGYSGAGKSTLEQAVLARIADMQYLKNTTTRPARPDDHTEYAYDFVSKEVYNKRRSKPNWNHIEYAGFSYGIDVDAIREHLAQDTHIIGSAIPDALLIRRLRDSFATPSYLIWLDTPLPTANERISMASTERSLRISNHLQTQKQGEDIKRKADFIFRPSNTLNQDEDAFVDLVQKILLL